MLDNHVLVLPAKVQNRCFDLDASGTIDATDVSMAKARAGKALP